MLNLASAYLYMVIVLFWTKLIFDKRNVKFNNTSYMYVYKIYLGFIINTIEQRAKYNI